MKMRRLLFLVTTMLLMVQGANTLSQVLPIGIRWHRMSLMVIPIATPISS